MFDYDWKREEAENEYNRIMTEEMNRKEEEDEEYDEEYKDEDFPVPYYNH